MIKIKQGTDQVKWELGIERQEKVRTRLGEKAFANMGKS